MADETALQISVRELREAAARLLDAVEREFGPTVNLDADFYWSLDAVESFDLSNQPRQDVGSIAEDVEDTRGLLTREDGEVYLWHDLAHLAGIFLRISALDTPRAGDST
jgi:hypothetical protein